MIARSDVRMASVLETVKNLQGAEIYWGAEGPLAGYGETDLKGHDSTVQP